MMNVKLDWQFDEEEFERPAGQPAARAAPAGGLAGSGPRSLEANAILLHVWLWNSFSDINPGRMYLAAALVIFGSLILLCLLV